MTTATDTDLMADIRKEWAPLEEVQRMLNVSRSTITRLIRDGILKAKKFGKGKWIRRADVKTYVSSIFSESEPRPAPRRRSVAV